jgi:hypothetical protein
LEGKNELSYRSIGLKKDQDLYRDPIVHLSKVGKTAKMLKENEFLFLSEISTQILLRLLVLSRV